MSKEGAKGLALEVREAGLRGGLRGGGSLRQDYADRHSLTRKHRSRDQTEEKIGKIDKVGTRHCSLGQQFFLSAFVAVCR